MSSGKLGLVIRDGLDLGRGRALRIEAISHPLASELLGELDADNPLAETEDLGVVAEDGAFDRERVVGGHGTDPGNLVGGNGHAETGSADEETTVGFAFADQLGACDGGMGVGGLVGGRVNTDVGDGGDERVLL